ncbi:MAG: HipA domain-containing protein [Brevundimonas sp.]|uniref:HipA domain-containing protein n=1 Tax=Brevundimonas mediterranea TaxID=74329 RepID=A0AB37E9H4_9CAUL|nr:HipA domain-containing protein [Brevundimonas sp.]OYX81089.1 MAG: hypothetical protein B7Y85_03150 [Brevundimonas sp. 32-68-21]QIH73653.1 HipA domain-containing protein [Brevundimonas mediterranea]TAJ50430.1 MAG: HipA domain-containing protein [Brevundimonas sp.]
MQGLVKIGGIGARAVSVALSAIGGTDVHAKNYAFLIAEEGQVRLAPLYDISSALPYDGLQYQRLKPAMKLGGEYYLRDIGPVRSPGWRPNAK